jgi:hypothetical protein
VQFAAAAGSVAENVAGGTVSVKVTRTGAALAGGVTVAYAVTGGTATRDGDYTLADGTLTFAAGETAKTVSVGILSDALHEDSETVVLTLRDPTGGASLGAQTTHTLTLVDTLTLNWHLQLTISVEGESETASTDFTCPRAGGTATRTIGYATVRVTTTPTGFSFAGSGSATDGGATCTVSLSGSGALRETDSTYTVSGGLAGRATCYSAEESGSAPITGSFVATAPK